ncbi:MAG: BBP7 family outer membrane beta-barrel protein [Pirellulaceae bacterium]
MPNNVCCRQLLWTHRLGGQRERSEYLWPDQRSFVQFGRLNSRQQRWTHVANDSCLCLGTRSFNVNVILYNGLSANVGYSAFYWGNVSRAGEQIDIRNNPNLTFRPPPVPVGTIGSQHFNTLSDLVAHGLNVGIAYRF